MTLLIGRTSRRSLRSRSPLLPGLILLTALAFALSACGVKNDLIKPNGQTTSKDDHDPSKPPFPLGR